MPGNLSSCPIAFIGPLPANQLGLVAGVVERGAGLPTWMTWAAAASRCLDVASLIAPDGGTGEAAWDAGACSRTLSEGSMASAVGGGKIKDGEGRQGVISDAVPYGNKQVRSRQ